ncbi:MAG: ECF-type sigma factor [Rhodothermales bacterium]
MTPKSEDVTQLLIKWRAGETDAFEALMPLVYEELRRLAHHYLKNERSDHTFHTTDLVHEAYLNLAGKDGAEWENRTHFFAVAAHAMRAILIDYARRRNRKKRGGGQVDLRLEDVHVWSENHLEDLISLDQAMNLLAEIDIRLCQIVECRYFGGLTISETAEALDISPATVKRDWQVAKAWLRRAISEQEH